MLRRRLGKSGIEVSELGLGTWGLSGDAYGAVVETEVERVIERALALGITIFDTADVYGRGDMERRLGNALKGTEPKDEVAAPVEKPSATAAPEEKAPAVEASPSGGEAAPANGAPSAVVEPPDGPGSRQAAPDPAATLAASAARPTREATYIVTKIGTDVEEGRKRFDTMHLRMAFERSQERLKRDVVDVVLLHNPTVAGVEKSDGVAFLEGLRKKKQIRAWGVSAGSPDVARAAIAKGADVVELAYNVFVAPDLHALAAEIAEKDVAVLARSVLAHGLLAGQWSPEREFYPGDHRLERWTPRELKRRTTQLGALRPLVAGSIMTMRAVALRFVLANQIVSSAILGPRSVAQLDQLVRESGGAPPYLSGAQLADLASRLKAFGVPT